MDCSTEFIDLSVHIYVSIRAVELRPDLSCLWKLLGDACTAVSNVSPHRAQVLVPVPLAGLDPSTQNPKLNQAQTLKVGERYEHKHPCWPSLESEQWTQSKCFCLQVLCPCLEADVWGPKSVVWPRTQLLSPVQPTLPYSRRTELPVSAPGKGAGGKSRNPSQPQFCIVCCEGGQFKSFFLSFQCMKKAIMLDSGNHSYWNALGVISLSKGNYLVIYFSYFKQ